MKIVSWNVAGIRACLKKGLKEYFAQEDADIFCMQEVKATKEQFDFNPLGYYEYLFPAVRKGYSGTLIYTKQKPQKVIYGIKEEECDLEGRVITLEFADFFLVNVYVPNVKKDLSRLNFRLYYEDIFRQYLVNLDKIKPVIICGDFNVAHEEIDLKNYQANRGNAGFTDEEREKFTKLIKAGFIDTFRYFYPTQKKYSWWSYLFHARENNAGWRIDYFLVSQRIIAEVKDSFINNDVYGSDHCPIGLIINLGGKINE